MFLHVVAKWTVTEDICKQLCKGILCQLEFTCSNILQIISLKELLANKTCVYNLKTQTNSSLTSHHFYRKQWLTKGLIFFLKNKIFIHWRFSVQFMTPTSPFTLSEGNCLRYKPHLSVYNNFYAWCQLFSQ